MILVWGYINQTINTEGIVTNNATIGLRCQIIGDINVRLNSHYIVEVG